MGLFKRLFRTKKEAVITSDSNEADIDDATLLRDFIEAGNGDRVRKVIRFGETGNPRYYPLLKYAILHDTDIHVKLAALKRIHFYKSDPDVVLLLNDLKVAINTNALEPYYSMALSRVGIITLEQFKEKMNQAN